MKYTDLKSVYYGNWAIAYKGLGTRLLLPSITALVALCIGCSDAENGHSVMDGAIEREVEVAADDASRNIMNDASDTMVPDELTPILTVPGPDPRLFDCRNQEPLRERRSPVALNCIIDPDCHESMVVGHRGVGGNAGTVAPENSLSAIRAALILGLDGVELDVRHTRDDVLVLMHDSTVDRTTFGSGLVSDMTLAEVTALKLRPPPAAGGLGEFECDLVPTLEDALALTAGYMFIDLDVKTHRVDLIVPMLRRLLLMDQVFISVGDVERAVSARAIDPSVRIQIRPDSLEEAMALVERFERAPEIIEIAPGEVVSIGPFINEMGSKVFADVFGLDVAGAILHNLDPYRELYALGAHVQQSEFPQLVMEALGRWSPDQDSEPSTDSSD
jgi:glycerophosphoryl diester phosphodiesterase